jgi:hypothetical protein
MPTVVWIIIVAVLMLFAGLVGWVLARFTESLEPVRLESQYHLNVM